MTTCFGPKGPSSGNTYIKSFAQCSPVSKPCI